MSEMAVGSPERSSARVALTPVTPGVHSPTRALPVEERAAVGLDPRLEPPDQPLQHLAFSEERLAQLTAEQLIVRRVPDMHGVSRIDMPGARNVVAGVGGDFVVAGSEHVYRLARLDERAEVLAPVPRLGPTTMLPAADSSDHFWLLYEGIQTLPEFDLQETVVSPFVSVLSWTQLSDFDGRAVSNPGDGSFIYTTPRGLRRVNAEGRAHDILLQSLGPQVWRLLPAQGRGRVWAATPWLLQLLQRVESEHSSGTARSGTELEVTRRIELPPHSVALASEGSELAVLAVESFEPARARLRVELYRQGSEGRRVLRFDDPLPEHADAGAAKAGVAQFAPEVALAPGRPWVAVFGFGLSVFDWRTGARLFPPGAAAASAFLPVQNLAPGPP